MSKVTLKNLNKSFGEVQAVKELNFDIQQGEFFSLLGPSGCGKTTTLRMIAGFEFPSSGQILFGGKDVTFLKPSLRNAGMVFQNFALFPHMTVFENIAFGLNARKVLKSEINRRVKKALDLVDLSGLGARKVTEISGGQQQRVALARAVVIEPEILLLDEPLSNLDAKLREETREEIKNLQQRLGITTIYVTHDQDEALTLSDRMAVLRHGVCQQIGHPEEIYRYPRTKFVASFVGNSNVLSGKLASIRTNVVETSEGLSLEYSPESNVTLPAGTFVDVSIRPESLKFANGTESGKNTFTGILQKVTFSGAVADYEIKLKDHTMRMKNLVGGKEFTAKVGDPVTLTIPPSQVRLLENDV